ncbi:hypothetical protein XFF6166_930002 [Xanthomonas citri pv. fuscans]|nr:hypothetical protein XFF6166_930002 [Xanthomonas citri pv. fuscans]SON98703.1 hypothetical protein XFF6960_1010002 [Xanthomonas citri pv. fuscans]SOO05108.1 hypothetical protein XFF7767_370003 [Xanthomonas citri pv. fuscans]SOO09064.1 hypothetical protein XFF6970_310002 [Xanthomonas citri pv. fuscans]SOO12177.1 hypothetical protein XFF7766_10082 [Xanthomonas citri pv. fuscans]
MFNAGIVDRFSYFIVTNNYY